MPRNDAATIAALAQQTQTEESVVQCLYDEEFAALAADSSVKNFISLIAARRVRERLRSHRTHPASRAAHRSRAA